MTLLIKGVTQISTFRNVTINFLKPPIKVLYSAPPMPQAPLSGAPSSNRMTAGCC